MSLVYCLVVTGPAYGSQQASSALQFAHAVLACGHQISSIFFYQDGVHNANRLTSPANDEMDLVRAWQQLGAQQGIALEICVAAALRRGVTDASESALAGHNSDNLQAGFCLSGLGSLAQAMLSCDRVIQF